MFDLWGNWWNLRLSRQMADQQETTGKVRTRVDSVDDRLERLMLVNVALWELLRDTQGLTDDMLRQKIEEVDLRDGHLDGKITQTARQCSECGRQFSRRHQKCIYCGAQAGGSPIG